MAADRTAPDVDPARDAAVAEIARIHLGFGSLARQNNDDRDFRDVAVWSVEAALLAAYAAGWSVGVEESGGRVPDCATAEEADYAGRISNAIMTRAVDIADGIGMYDLCCTGPRAASFPAYNAARQTAFRIIAARARASVRTPSHATLSGAAAALAVAEDLVGGTEDLIISARAEAGLAAIRDLLRAGLAPLRAEAAGQAPFDPGPATA